MTKFVVTAWIVDRWDSNEDHMEDQTFEAFDENDAVRQFIEG